MFGDLMGNMQEQQAKMAEKLKTIKISYDQDGISIEVNAAKEILNIELKEDLINPVDKEQLQDLLIVHLNRALEMAEAAQAKESKSLLDDIMPGGLGSIFGQ